MARKAEFGALVVASVRGSPTEWGLGLTCVVIFIKMVALKHPPSHWYLQTLFLSEDPHRGLFFFVPPFELF